MWDWIEKTRKKSRAERTQITFLMSAILTAIIALIWGTVVLPRTLTLNERAASNANASTPFRVLVENLGIIIDDTKSGLGLVRDAFRDNVGGAKNEDNEEVDDTAITEQDEVLIETGSRGKVEVSEVSEGGQIEGEADEVEDDPQGVEDEVIEPENTF